MRVRAILLGLLALSAAIAVIAATPAKKTKTKPAGAKKTAKKASTAKTAKAKGSTAAKNTAGKKAASSKKSSSAKQTSRYRRSTQREPEPDRYKEIQQSLAEKGYYSGPVNGAWGPDSVEALKRFQRDQNIDDDGKLGALSLIALGLGPKRGTSAAEKPENSPISPP